MHPVDRLLCESCGDVDLSSFSTFVSINSYIDLVFYLSLVCAPWVDHITSQGLA